MALNTNHNTTDRNEKLGDVLIRQGSLTTNQRNELLDHQLTSGRPLGLLAEELFDVAPSEIERAWAEQYAALAERVSAADISPLPELRGAVTARQAWQFRVLPLRVDRGTVVILTSPQHLVRAHKFGVRTLSAVVGAPIRVALCDEFVLFDALERYYRLDGAREFVVRAA